MSDRGDMTGVVASLLLLTGCASAEMAAVQREPYVYELHPGDRVHATFFWLDLTVEFVVDESGVVSLPDGPVKVTGASVREAEALVEKSFVDAGHYPSRIWIEIVSALSIYVLGDVEAPGRYEYVEDMRLEDALAIAGGQSGSVVITNDEVVIRDASYDTPVYPGDVIEVRERFF